jgi:hypothetical protein
VAARLNPMGAYNWTIFNMSNKKQAIEERHADFCAELAQLCSKHRVMLSASGYDDIQLWDADGTGETINQGAEQLVNKLIELDAGAQ